MPWWTKLVFLGLWSGIRPDHLDEMPVEWVERLETYQQAEARAGETHRAHSAAGMRNRKVLA